MMQYQLQKNAVRQSEYRVLDHLIAHFSQKTEQYDDYDTATEAVNYYSRGAKKALIVWGAILAAFGSIFLLAQFDSEAASLATVGLFVFLLPGLFMIFGGIMKGCRMLDAVTAFFIRAIRGRTSMVAATVASGSFFNAVLADQYLAIILTGGMYLPVYAEKGYEPRLLSRTVEDAVTVVSPLIPWSTCGMTQATMLNVPTLAYLPYSFFNLLCPVFTLAVAATGFGIRRALVSAKAPAARA
jgi:NhaC family Na+:H+ antiporter